MKPTNPFLRLGLAFVIAALGAFAAACQTESIPLVWTIEFSQPVGAGTVDSAIQSDGSTLSNPSYVDGVDRVSAHIQACAPNRNAILDTGRRKARLAFSSDSVLDSNALTPAWASSVTLIPTYFNIIHLGYIPSGYSADAEFTFTTRMIVTFTTSDRIQYKIESSNPNIDPTVPQSTRPSINLPNVTAPVVIHHIPASGTNPETWEVYPDPSTPTPPQVFTIYRNTKSGFQDAGQIKVPFFFRITRK